MKQPQPCNKEYLKGLQENHCGNSLSDTLFQLFWRAYDHFGPQYWWPGQTPFEVAIGAILTQNTSWQNVEKAIDNLKGKGLLSPHGLMQLEKEQLAQLIRPAGYFNIKADRLRNFLEFLYHHYQGSMERMKEEETQSLRQKLLQIKGIGPETADSILLYALEHPIFVIDAYTFRILIRHDIVDGNMDYHELQEVFMTSLPNDPCLFNEYHALLVAIGKNFCKKKRPSCSMCPIKGL